jgi:membrane fusion protein (multidrug efflux system)
MKIINSTILSHSVLTGVVLSLLLCTGCSRNSKQDQEALADPVPVLVEVLVEENVNRPIVCEGNVYPVRQEKLSFLASGRIFRIFYDLDQRVEKGETIALLDTELLTRAWVENGLKLIAARQGMSELEIELENNLISQADYDEAEAETELLADIYLNAKAALQNPALIAPFSGRIIEQYTSPGENITAGEPMFLLANVDPKAIARVDLQEADYYHIEVGDEVTVTPQDQWGLPLQGIINSKELSDAATGLFYSAEILFENPGGSAELGVRVSAAITGDYQQRVIVIPQDALVDREPTEASVFLTDSKGKFALRRHVLLGPEMGHKIIIIKGLLAGERLILQGQQRLMHGSRIVILN